MVKESLHGVVAVSYVLSWAIMLQSKHRKPGILSKIGHALDPDNPRPTRDRREQTGAGNKLYRSLKIGNGTLIGNGFRQLIKSPKIRIPDSFDNAGSLRCGI